MDGWRYVWRKGVWLDGGGGRMDGDGGREGGEGGREKGGRREIGREWWMEEGRVGWMDGGGRIEGWMGLEGEREGREEGKKGGRKEIGRD